MKAKYASKKMCLQGSKWLKILEWYSKWEWNFESHHILSVKNNDYWIIDSGCANPMTRYMRKFIIMEECDGGVVIFGNGSPCVIKDKGSIVLNEKITCDDVYWADVYHITCWVFLSWIKNVLELILLMIYARYQEIPVNWFLLVIDKR